MKNIIEYIAESFDGSQTRKYHIDRTCSSNIVVWDTEGGFTYFKDIDGAQKYADDYDKISKATNKVIDDAPNNRFIVIDLDNPSPYMEKCISKYNLREDIENDKKIRNRK